MLSIYEQEDAELVDGRKPLLPPREPKSRLHNFSFPTGSWGSTRFLRCSKPPSGSAPPASTDPKPLEAAAAAAAASADEEASSIPGRPWNLRTRRAACSAPLDGAAGASGKVKYAGSGSPVPFSSLVEKGANGGRTVRLRSEDGEKGEERRKFSVQLSREEIEEDFYALKGTKPLRRPKKRPRNVQRQLDMLFPGLWLSEVTPDTYKIDD